MALATSVLARVRNAKLSALAYRISTVLFHGGLRMADMIHLNHLGVGMSLSRVINLQKQMGMGSNSKVLIWKKSMEEVLGAVRFLQEVRLDQVPDFEEDDMEVEVNVDLSEARAQTYLGYDKALRGHPRQNYVSNPVMENLNSLAQHGNGVLQISILTLKFDSVGIKFCYV